MRLAVIARPASIAIAGVAITALLAVGSATAHKKKFDTSAALTGNAQGVFRATVSAKGGCRTKRAVSLFHNDEYSGRTLVGTGTTNSSGEATFTPSAQPAGGYQAVVAAAKVKKGKKKNGKPRHKHKCLEGSSPTLSYGGGPNPPPPVPVPDY